MRKLLPVRTERSIYIQTFGRFCVLLDGNPVPHVGKTKEILALIEQDEQLFDLSYLLFNTLHYEICFFFLKRKFYLEQIAGAVLTVQRSEGTGTTIVVEIA